MKTIKAFGAASLMIAITLVVIISVKADGSFQEEGHPIPSCTPTPVITATPTTTPTKTPTPTPIRCERHIIINDCEYNLAED